MLLYLYLIFWLMDSGKPKWSQNDFLPTWDSVSKNWKAHCKVLSLYMCAHSVVSDSSQPHGDCSLPGSSAHGISQERIPEWVAISFSRGSSWPRDWSHAFCISAGSLSTEPPGKLPFLHILLIYYQRLWIGYHILELLFLILFSFFKDRLSTSICLHKSLYIWEEIFYTSSIFKTLRNIKQAEEKMSRWKLQYVFPKTLFLNVSFKRVSVICFTILKAFVSC